VQVNALKYVKAPQKTIFGCPRPSKINAWFYRVKDQADGQIDQLFGHFLAFLDNGILHDAGLAQWLGNPMAEMASFVVEEGCGAWSVGC
jgi:hypothetical protein